MRDWAYGIETRNYGIKCKIEIGTLMELMRIIMVFAVVAGAFLYYSWIRSHIVNTGYEIQDLFEQEKSLLRTQKTLILEEETLRNPQRIDIIARSELGMIPLRPNQIIPPQMQDVARSIPNEMAMADTEAMDLTNPVSSMSTSGIRTIR